MAVADIITSQQAYATAAVTGADTFLAGLTSLADLRDITIGDLPNPTYLSRDSSALSQFLLLSMQPSRPTFDPVAATAPTFTPDTIDTVPSVPVPDFTGSVPSIDIPSPPSSAIPTAPLAPSVSDPVIPSAPTVSLPVAPTVNDITVPAIPVIAVELFTSTSPLDDLVAPTSVFQFFEEAYQTSLLDEVSSKLLTDLQDGTYGIEPADEQALYDRAREREAELANVDIQGAYTQQAVRGFPLPPGDLNVALQRARQEHSGKTSSINRDIMIKRNEQFVEARKFTIERAIGLEQILIGFHNSIMERSLNSAKAVLDSGIALFNATVAQFNARQEAYRTEAQVFESKIRASMVQVEIYRTQMDGKKLESELQRNRVEVYRAQLEGVGTVVNLYKSELEAAAVQADIERTRIEAFRALVSGYASQVQGKVAEFNMYDSQIKGELAKAEVYRTEAAAYESIVGGAKAKSDILIANVNAQISKAGQGVDEYKARIEAYRADLTGQTATLNGTTAIYGSDVAGYRAAVGALTESYRLESNAQALEDRVNTQNKEVAVENGKLTLAAQVAALDVAVKAGDSGADFHAALASGAINSINALSSLAE